MLYNSESSIIQVAIVIRACCPTVCRSLPNSFQKLAGQDFLLFFGEQIIQSTLTWYTFILRRFINRSSARNDGMLDPIVSIITNFGFEPVVYRLASNISVITEDKASFFILEHLVSYGTVRSEFFPGYQSLSVFDRQLSTRLMRLHNLFSEIPV